MLSSPLESIHDQTMSGMACHRHSWTTHTIELHRVWHAITALRQHTRSDDVGRGMPSLPFDSSHGQTTLVWHATWTLGSTHVWMMSILDCHHNLWPAYKDERSRAWNAIIALGLYAQCNIIRRAITSSLFGSTHGEMILVVTCQIMSGVACHNRPWTAHTIGRHRASHAHMTLGQ